MLKSISRSTVAVLLVCFSLSQILAQTNNQMIRGVVKDKWSGKPLPGTYLVLDNGTKGVVTDSAGRFRLSNVQVGRHYLSSFLTGYATWVSPDLWIESGKETVLDIIMEELHTDLPEIILHGESMPRQSMGQLNLLSQEMTLRYPATLLWHRFTM
ncbi:MAG: carboxypeptidase-like regulatory domain-containing protein [Bacteroidota bacterium]